MQIDDVNENLITIINQLINTGWSKTKISQILLGANGQTQINNLLKADGSNLGIKPLMRIAELFDCSISLVFDDQKDSQFTELVEQRNIQFLKNLKTAVTNCLENIENPELKLQTVKPNKELQQLITNVFDV